jgi:hypothetical protein
MSSHAWEQQGAFFVARATHVLLARTASFDEEFRDYARSQRAKWDGLEKAWVFSSSKEQEVLHHLAKMTAEKQAKTKQHAETSSKISDELAQHPFNFHSAKLHVEMDLPQQRFVVRFPYNEALSMKLRQAGGRWCPDMRAYSTPLSSIELLKQITEQPRREQTLFDERNAPFLSLEALSPLSSWLDERQGIEGLHEIKIEANPMNQTYKATFPFGIDSPLGESTIRPLLTESKALDFVRINDTDRMYPRCNLNSVVFEMCQRPLIETALLAILKQLERLGPYTKIDINNASMEGRRWRNQRVEPQSGELVLLDNKAWLIAKAQKTKNKTTLRVHPLTADEAQKKLAFLPSTSQRRVCDMSGIDFEALQSYVESLFLNEASRADILSDPPAKKMRL